MKNLILIIFAVVLFGVVQHEEGGDWQVYCASEPGGQVHYSTPTRDTIKIFNTIKEVNDYINPSYGSFRVFKLEEVEVKKGTFKVEKELNYVEEK